MSKFGRHFTSKFCDVMAEKQPDKRTKCILHMGAFESNWQQRWSNGPSTKLKLDRQQARGYESDDRIDQQKKLGRKESNQSFACASEVFRCLLCVHMLASNDIWFAASSTFSNQHWHNTTLGIWMLSTHTYIAIEATFACFRRCRGKKW